MLARPATAGFSKPQDFLDSECRATRARLLADGVDILIIQLMLGHASIQQAQRYLNVTDEELRRGLDVSWNHKGRPLRLASGA